MGTIGFYLFYCINWIITLLPLPVLYLFSDLLFLFVYYFPGYRRKVVATNLKNSFPEKSELERIAIEKKFYHHLCDLIVEVSKLTHMSNKELVNRMKFINPELFDRLFDEGRDVAGVIGHHNNWEWLICLPHYTKLKIITIYKPLQNRHFDKHMRDVRSRFGIIMTPMSQVIREILNCRRNNIRSFTAFGADQTPPKDDIKYWTLFLNQETPVFLGPEKISAKYDMAVVLINIQKVRRGYYTFTAEVLFEHTKDLPEHFVTDTHVKRLGEIIRERPEFWLWSHRRWKYKKEHVNG